MLTLLLRKMRNTKWMVLCLLIGFVMASAMLSTIPIYMNASLKRMLVKDMEELQLTQNVYPGIYAVQSSISLNYSVDEASKKVSDYIDTTRENFAALGLPSLGDKLVLIDDYDYVTSITTSEGNSKSSVKVGSMTNIEDHISIVDGRMYTPGKRDDGVYEVIATEQALKLSGLTINTVYDVISSFDIEGTNPMKIEIVGMFTVGDANDAYWSEGLDSTYLNTVFMDHDTFLEGPVANQNCTISSFSMRYSIDYQNMDMTDLKSLNEMLLQQKKSFAYKNIKFTFPAMEILQDYEGRAHQLKLILWLIQIPVMLMIVFYLFMVSQLNVEQEKNEIAVFKSRGASSFQIFRIYALESLVLGVFTAIIGPFLALGFCTVLGASNGFLEFVNRTALPIKLTLDAFLYSLLAAVVFFITTMAPIIPAARVSIVEHKQRKARKKKRPLWEKLFLDVILIGGSVGWLYYYNYSQENLVDSGMVEAAQTVNPMLFVASTAFILGCALFIVRLHPLIIRLIYTIGKKKWSPAAYVSLNNIGRSSTGRERFLMVFLILTVSLGVFFANTARAINRNAEERVTYSLGCDAVISENWETQAVTTYNDEGEEVTSLAYTEPVIERFSDLKGVKNIARVLTADDATLSGACIEKPVTRPDRPNRRGSDELDLPTTNSVSDCNIMAIVPGEFAKVVQPVDRLLPVHINNYLNGLNNCSSGVILSSSFRDKYTVKLGDTVTVKIGDNAEFEAVVIAFAEFWPSLNPYENQDFAVFNYNYVSANTEPFPYDVWADLDDSVSTADFYQSIEDSDIDLASVTAAKQEKINEKNDPMLQGLNGALTLGFITIMIMCIIGFLIYWILSIKGRTLQFGILRAMGMKFREIIAMIIYEQLLVSAVAIVMAFVVGYYAGKLYIPLFESIYGAQEMVPQLEVISQRSDYYKIYAIIALMLLIGIAVLGKLISKINISKALKLGEE